jgi:predicted porin
MEAGDMAEGVNGAAVFLTAPGSNPAQSYHAGVTQTIPGIGKVSFLYAPSDTTGNAATANDKNFVEDNNESAMEIGFNGDLGVKGLNAHAFANKQKATSGSKAVTATSVNDHKGYNWGASYNMGSVTLGYDYKKEGAVAINADTKQNSFGAAYAVDKNLTVGLNYTKADKEGTTVDAKAKTLMVGYSLGPVALIANVSQLENITGTAGVDANVLYLAARTSF